MGLTGRPRSVFALIAVSDVPEPECVLVTVHAQRTLASGTRGGHGACIHCLDQKVPREQLEDEQRFMLVFHEGQRRRCRDVRPRHPSPGSSSELEATRRRASFESAVLGEFSTSRGSPACVRCRALIEVAFVGPPKASSSTSRSRFRRANPHFSQS